MPQPSPYTQLDFRLLFSPSHSKDILLSLQLKSLRFPTRATAAVIPQHSASSRNPLVAPHTALPFIPLLQPRMCELSCSNTQTANAFADANSQAPMSLIPLNKTQTLCTAEIPPPRGHLTVPPLAIPLPISLPNAAIHTGVVGLPVSQALSLSTLPPSLCLHYSFIFLLCCLLLFFFWVLFCMHTLRSLFPLLYKSLGFPSLLFPLQLPYSSFISTLHDFF